MKKVPIEPLGHRVLLKMKPLEEKTAGGIILTNESYYKRQMAEMNAEVLALGEEAFIDHAKKPEVGDWVLIPKHAGLLYEIEGVDYRLLDDTHIQGIIR